MDQTDPTTSHQQVLALALEGRARTLTRLLATGPPPPSEAVRAGLAEAAEALSRLSDALEVEVGPPRAAQRVAMSAVEVTVPVLGVDACKGGWVGVVLEPGAPRPRVAVARGIRELVETVRSSVHVQVVGIDIPIGLPDHSVRLADALARKALPRKASSVFSTLTRAAYEAPDRASADAVNRARCGQGVGTQAFALRDKIVAVDAWVRSRPTVTVIEVHPELSFATMNGAPILPNKKTNAGRRERLAALQAVGIASPSVLNGSGYASDDVLDACAVAWSAARVANGLATPRPPTPERFSDGIPAAIWA